MQLIQNGQDFKLANLGALPDKLPLGTYTLQFDDLTKSYYLHQIEDIQLPSKIYGDSEVFADRVCTKYESVDRNLGVLMVGNKGAGKTLTGKLIASRISAPIIIITEGYDDSDFISFITDPTLGNCVIIIDEFEKLYDPSNADSNKLLSLLDGPYNTHHIFILTVNEFWKVNDMMKNRPSRIHFLKEFTGLEDDVVEQIGLDILENKSYVPELVEVGQKMSECTFDTIVSLCKDCNLYHESPKICVKWMNILIEKAIYEAYVEYNGISTYENTIQFNDAGLAMEVLWLTSAKQKTDTGEYMDFRFCPNEYTPVFKTSKEMLFDLTEEHGFKIHLKKTSKSKINYIY